MDAMKESELGKERALLQEITRATNEERIRWLPTAKLNEFTGSFNGRWSVVVGKEEGEEYYVRIEDDHGAVILCLTGMEFLGGRTLDEIALAQAQEPVRQLFEAVSRKAFHSDKRIEEFLQDLKRA